MNCEQARELCQDRCDGDLSRGPNDELAAHVRSCAACREYERQMAALIGGLDTLRDESAALMFAEPAAAPRVAGRPKNRSWAVAARGFNGRFNNKLAVMIDGRTVFSSLFSGVYWEVQDLRLENIERI